jgi:hypothetical protein
VDLQPTTEPGVRFCQDCQKNVYHCTSLEEVEQHALSGNCIAISSRVAMEVGPDDEWDLCSQANECEDPISDEPLFMGGPELPSPYHQWARQMFRRHHKRWWQFWR